MLNIRWIRENPEQLTQEMQRRGFDIDVGSLLALDIHHRHTLHNVQSLQEERNRIARQIPEAKKEGLDTTALLAQAQKIKTELPLLEASCAAAEQALLERLHHIPNLLAADVPFGKSEANNLCVRTWGYPRSFDFSPLPHDQLGTALGQMRFDLAARMSGSRFVILLHQLARLERALGQFMLDIHTKEFGYQEVSPPLMVRSQAAYGVGQLPKFEEDLFKTTTGHYLISTAEVPLTNMVADQILPEGELPLRFTALTPCFRSEAGAAGRDTKGMIRVHQFYKVELVSVVTPAQAEAEHARMLSAAEEVLKRLELPYRVMLLCSGDTGFCSRKTYDLEVWIPSQDTYREVSSCSWFGDFQARSMNTRYRQEGEETSTTLHTLNGSGVAVGRALVAIMENYQQPDGSILVPKALQPFTGFDKIEAKIQ